MIKRIYLETTNLFNPNCFSKSNALIKSHKVNY